MNNTSPVLDESVIRQMIEDTSRDCMPVMLSAFCEELLKRQQLLKDALHSEDLAELTEQAHAIKSCAGTFGAQRLHQQAMALEDKARTLTLRIDQLVDETQALLAMIGTTQQCYVMYAEQHFAQ